MLTSGWKNRIPVALLVFVALLWAVTASARTYLVAVGINDYRSFPSEINNLDLPINDATEIYRLFPGNGDTKHLLVDGKATRKNILTTMKKVFARAGKDDTVLFYFSGHGYPGGFCAFDGMLDYTDIGKVMTGTRAQKRIIMADACHSGALRTDARQSARQTEHVKKADVMMFLASRNNESSLENPTMKNGYFTHHLLQGLRGGADANRDKTITAHELYDYVQRHVVTSTNGRQHPVMWGNFSNNMPIVRLK